MKNNVSKFLAFVCVVAMIACAGCGGRSQVSGKVVFSDGTPLTYGTVNFTNNEVACKGQIEKDGTFKMRTFKPGDGVPPGTYKVFITDTTQFGDTGATVKTANATDKGSEAVGYSVIGKSTNTIPQVYANPDQSPFEPVTVKGTIKNLTLAIEAEAPASTSGE